MSVMDCCSFRGYNQKFLELIFEILTRPVRIEKGFSLLYTMYIKHHKPAATIQYMYTVSMYNVCMHPITVLDYPHTLYM